MSKRLLTILLFISLFLNAGIIGGMIVMGFYRQYHIAHHYLPDSEGIGSDRGRIQIPELKDPEVIALRNRFRSIKKELMQELAKDPVDEAKIKAIIEKSISAQSDMERALGYELLEYRQTLSADEAKKHFEGRLERMNRFSDRRNDRRKSK